MAEKFSIDNLTKQELAKHLRKPDGENGKEVGKKMNKGNKHICLNSYKILSPKPNSSILEIGMGNGYFVKDLMLMNANLEYIGLDYSKTMVEEATELNSELIQKNKVSFIEGSIDKLPFEDGAFDYITTTNTVYFWPDLIAYAQELYRVLRPNGKLLIGYRSKKMMDKIELAKYGFTKFESQDIEKLLESTGFKKIETQVIKEPDLDFDGEELPVEGLYTTGFKL